MGKADPIMEALAQRESALVTQSIGVSERREREIRGELAMIKAAKALRSGLPQLDELQAQAEKLEAQSQEAQRVYENVQAALDSRSFQASQAEPAEKLDAMTEVVRAERARDKALSELRSVNDRLMSVRTRLEEMQKIIAANEPIGGEYLRGILASVR